MLHISFLSWVLCLFWISFAWCFVPLNFSFVARIFYVLSCGRLASFIHTLCFIFFTCCSRGRGPLFVGQVYIMFPAWAGTLACSWRKSDTSVRFRTKHAMVLIQIQHMKGYQVKWKVERGPTHATWGYSKFHQTVSGKQNQSDWRVASFE